MDYLERGIAESRAPRCRAAGMRYGNSVNALRMRCGYARVSRREAESLSAGCLRAGGFSPTELLGSNATGFVAGSNGKSESIRSDPTRSPVIHGSRLVERGVMGVPDVFGYIRIDSDSAVSTARQSLSHLNPDP